MPSLCETVPPCCCRERQTSAPTICDVPFAVHWQPGCPGVEPGQNMAPYRYASADDPLTKYVPLIAGSDVYGGPLGAQTTTPAQAGSVLAHQLLPLGSGHAGVTLRSQGADSSPYEVKPSNTGAERS